MCTHEQPTQVTPIQEHSPTALEPDTIDVLRAALVDDLSGTPQSKRASVTLPPASMHGRNVVSSPDMPTPQGSPPSRLSFETPRGATTTPLNPVRTPKLSNIFSTPASTGTSMQASTSAQDAQCPTPSPSPPSQRSEVKSRRLSWPSTPRNPVRAIVARVRDASAHSEGDDGASTSQGIVNAVTAEVSCDAAEHDAGTAKLQPVAVPLTPAAPKTAKTMPKLPREGGLLDGSGAAVHGVASPLRRRWLGVLGSTSSVTPNPPTPRV